jgi:hypothetical protein
MLNSVLIVNLDSGGIERRRLGSAPIVLLTKRSGYVLIAYYPSTRIRVARKL